MILVYITDNKHSYNSFNLIAVATNKANAIQLICNQVNNENEKLTDNDHFNLENINQTQGYKGEGEFLLQEIETNTLF